MRATRPVKNCRVAGQSTTTVKHNYWWNNDITTQPTTRGSTCTGWHRRTKHNIPWHHGEQWGSNMFAEWVAKGSQCIHCQQTMDHNCAESQTTTSSCTDTNGVTCTTLNDNPLAYHSLCVRYNVQQPIVSVPRLEEQEEQGFELTFKEQ